MATTQIVFPKKRRDIIRHQNKFNATNQIWNKYHYNQRSNIGTISFLSRCAHEKYKTKNPTLVMGFQQWQDFYLNSGKQRAALIQENGNKPQYDKNYGRTLEDIALLADRFQKDCQKEGIVLTESESFNYCYIRIVDEGYIGYQRELSALLFLQSRYPDLNFCFSDSYEDVYLGIDIKVYQKKTLIGGLQVKSVIYKNSDKQYNIEAKLLNQKQFERCRHELHFSPQYLFIGKKGNVEQPFPVFC